MLRFLLILLVPGISLAQSANPKWDALQQRMHQFVDAGDLAGVVTVVGTSKGVLHESASGFANLDAKTPMTKTTLFRIASMTKPITAMGIMILVDEGKLSVEDAVEKHLPEFKGQMLVTSREKDKVVLGKPERPITIRDLLTHTSGLPGGYGPGLADVYTKRNRTLAETTLVISQRPLDFPPGSKWSYCNAGIDTLGRIIEVTSRQSYESFLNSRIFDPLGMTSTTFFPTVDEVKGLATTYNKVDGKLKPAGTLIVDYAKDGKHPIPAGGLFSTGADMAKLYGCLLNKTVHSKGRLLSEKSFTEMTKTQTGNIKTGFVDGMSFGFGFAVVVEPKGVTEMLSPGTFGHGGAFGTQSWADPKQNAYFILMIQRTGLTNGDASEMRKEFQRLAVDAMKP